MDLFVVHNPQAGDGSWTRARLERVLRDAGHTPTIVDAKADWPDWLDDVVPDAFVAVGGDGTFQRLAVAVAVAGSSQPITILPTGTANNIARVLSGPDPAELAERIERWGRHEGTLHLAEARVGSRRRPFVEVAGAGAFAHVLGHKPDVASGTPAAAELLAGRHRLAQEILGGQPSRATISVDGTTVEDEFLLIACLNLPAFGARVTLAPAESADSTLLTVCAVRAGDRVVFADWLVDPETDPAAWHVARGHDVTMATAAPTHVDDRLWPESHDGTAMHLSGGVASVRVWI